MRLAAFVLVAAALSWGRLEVVDAGHLGSSRISELADPPADLGRMSRDERESWRLQTAEAVAALAREEGRLDATCELEFLKVDTARGGVDLRVRLKEGPAYSFGTISTVLLDPPSIPPAPPTISVRSGQLFQQVRINQAIQEAQRHYRHLGWLDANVSYEIEVRKDSQKVDLRLDVRLGRVAVFDGIQVNFHDKHLTPASRLRNLWNVSRGDTIRNEDIQKYNRKLAQTRLFSQAKVTRVPSPDDSTRTVLQVEVGERVPGSLDLSLSWEPTYGWGVGSLIRHRNVGGTFNELSLQTKVAEGVQNVRAGHYTPLLLGSPLAFDDGITLQQQQNGLGDSSLYREITVAGDGTFSYVLADWSNLSVKLGTQRDTKYLISKEEKVTYQISSDLGWTLDFRDEPFDPMEGWSLRTDLGWGDQFYPKDTSWVWVQAQARMYQPLFWRFLSAYALEGGQFLNPTTYDGSKIFWMGGPRTVRSYGFDELRASRGDTSAALQPRYVRGSAELRMNLPWSLQLVGFVDWARIWNKGEEPDLLSPSKAFWAYGPGIRYHLSLLSFRLDYSIGRGTWAFDLAQAI